MPAGGLISVCYNDWFPVPGVTLSGLDWDDGPRGLLDSVAPKTGSYASDLPTDPNPYATVAGAKVTSYFDDYYNRIHFTPNRYDFGAITSEMSTDIRVWNAYLGLTVTLNGIAIDSAAGLAVSPGSGQTFASLQERTFTLTAGTSGAAVVDVPVAWVFGIPYTYEFPVTGTRAKEWPLEPNWNQTYKITYSFKTEVLKSRSGKEQRIALRNSPRKEVSYQSTAIGGQFNRVKDLLWSWQDNSFVIPELPRFVSSITEMDVGDDSLQVDYEVSWLLPGTVVMLRWDTTSSLRVVESSAAGTLTFKSTSGENWPIGTRVYAALSGYADPAIQVTRVTNNVAQVNLRFGVTPLSEKWPEPPVAPDTFNCRELFLKRPNWAQEVSGTAQHEIDEIDYDRGGVFRVSPVAFGTENRRATYLNRDAEEAQLLLDLFLRMRGRQGEFYMPTWEYDFAPKDAVSSGSATMRVADTTLADCYGDSTVHKALFVMLGDGSLIFRKVLSVAIVADGGGTDSAITISGTWGASFTADSIVMCGWMPVWRLASDELTVEWLTNTVAQVQLTMQTVEDLPV